jgi:chromosome segregation ATPase
LFANRWSAIYYHLKSIKATGWSATLVDESFIISNHLQSYQDTIDSYQSQLDELQALIDEKIAEAEAEDSDYTPTKTEKAELKKIKDNLTQSHKDLHNQVQLRRESCSPDQAKALIHQQRQQSLQDLVMQSVHRQLRVVI